MGGVTAGGTGDSWEGWASTQLARGGSARGLLCFLTSLPAMTQGCRDEPADAALDPGTGGGPGKGLSEMVTGWGIIGV